MASHKAWSGTVGGINAVSCLPERFKRADGFHVKVVAELICIWPSSDATTGSVSTGISFSGLCTWVVSIWVAACCEGIKGEISLTLSKGGDDWTPLTPTSRLIASILTLLPAIWPSGGIISIVARSRMHQQVTSILLQSFSASRSWVAVTCGCTAKLNGSCRSQNTRTTEVPDDFSVAGGGLGKRLWDCWITRLLRSWRHVVGSTCGCIPNWCCKLTNTCDPTQTACRGDAIWPTAHRFKRGLGNHSCKGGTPLSNATSWACICLHCCSSLVDFNGRIWANNPRSLSSCSLKPLSRHPHAHGTVCCPHEWRAVGSFLSRFTLNCLKLMQFALNVLNSAPLSCRASSSASSHSFTNGIKSLTTNLLYGMGGTWLTRKFGWHAMTHHLCLQAVQVSSSLSCVSTRWYPKCSFKALRCCRTKRFSLAGATHSIINTGHWNRWTALRVAGNVLERRSFPPPPDPPRENGWHDTPDIKVKVFGTLWWTSIKTWVSPMSPGTIGTCGWIASWSLTKAGIHSTAQACWNPAAWSPREEAPIPAQNSTTCRTSQTDGNPWARTTDAGVSCKSILTPVEPCTEAANNVMQGVKPVGASPTILHGVFEGSTRPRDMSDPTHVNCMTTSTFWPRVHLVQQGSKTNGCAHVSIHMAKTVGPDLPEICKRYPPLAGFWAEAT